MTRYLLPLFTVLLLAALTGCGDTAADTETPATAPSVSEEVPPPAEPLTAATEIITWVDKINVRAEPSTKSKVVARIPNGEPMVYAGEQSATEESILLRGVVYKERWLKVTTNDGKDGWVFGGAVKRPGEKKGNQVISDTKLDFPNFGRYDLSDWQKLDATTEESGDATITTTEYNKDAKIMEIISSDTGEYGYATTHNLWDVEGKLLLTRTIEFRTDNEDVDALGDTPQSRLSEEVTNYLSRPMTKYTRGQMLDKHPIVLGGNPMMVNGPWKIEELTGVTVPRR